MSDIDDDVVLSLIATLGEMDRDSIDWFQIQPLPEAEEACGVRIDFTCADPTGLRTGRGEVTYLELGAGRGRWSCRTWRP